MNCFLIMLFGCWKYTPDDFIFIYIEKMLSYNWIIFCVSLFLIAVFLLVRFSAAGAFFCCWCAFLLLVRFSAATAATAVSLPTPGGGGGAAVPDIREILLEAPWRRVRIVQRQRVLLLHNWARADGFLWAMRCRATASGNSTK